MSLWIYKNFLKKNECKKLSEWVVKAAKNNQLGGGVDGINSTSYGLKSDLRLSTREDWEERSVKRNRLIDLSQQLPDLVYEVRDRIQKVTDTTDLKHSWQGSSDGIFANYTKPGGDLYEHYDPMEDFDAPVPRIHCLRLNIVTQMSERGGVLHVAKHPVLNLEEGDLHGYVASLHPHSVTKIEGSVDRVCWMFGFQLPNHIDKYEKWSGLPPVKLGK